MKKTFIIMASLTLVTLTSCQKHREQSQTNVIEEKSSLIQNWYGGKHFDEAKSESESTDTQDPESPNFLTPGGAISKPPQDFTSSSIPEDMEHFFTQVLFQDGPETQLN